MSTPWTPDKLQEITRDALFTVEGEWTLSRNSTQRVPVTRFRAAISDSSLLMLFPHVLEQIIADPIGTHQQRAASEPEPFLHDPIDEPLTAMVVPDKSLGGAYCHPSGSGRDLLALWLLSHGASTCEVEYMFSVSSQNPATLVLANVLRTLPRQFSAQNLSGTHRVRGEADATMRRACLGVLCAAVNFLEAYDSIRALPLVLRDPVCEPLVKEWREEHVRNVILIRDARK